MILELHKTQLLTSAQQGVAQAPKVKAAKVRAGRLGKRERAEMKAGGGDPSSSMVLGWGHVWPGFKYIAPALPAEEDVKSELASAEEGEAGVAEYIISAHVLRQIIRASAYSPPLIHLRRCPPIWAF